MSPAGTLSCISTMKKQLSILLFGAAALTYPAQYALADVQLAAQGKSPFSIAIAADAPASIIEAANELQLNIQKSTGVLLPLVKDDAATGAVISLGQTRQAKAAGVNAEGIEPEGFRLKTQGGNLYIIGPDTASNDDAKKFPESSYPRTTANGGQSNGTANGIYTFLEDYIGVRWLMPGELGRDVPSKSTLTIPDLDLTKAPVFIHRRMPYLQNTAAVSDWQKRQRLGRSFAGYWGHYWEAAVPKELFKDHPDWFAMIDGKRVPPKSHRFKLETTNPEVVRYYADKAIAALKAQKTPSAYSLSPNDGSGWSESPESKAWYDPPRPGSKRPSITPLILKWYRDVCEIVAKEYPQGKLTGYIYADFGYPPQKGGMELPENFTPVITGQDFGFRFYRKEVREEGAFLLREWAKVAPSTWFYYGMPIWLRNSAGQLTTASPDNLNFMFSLLRENKLKGADLYGTPEWSQTAVANYVQAQMLWDPSQDAFKLQRDWLTRAYGPQAGAVMERLYNWMDNGAYADFFRKDPSQHYNVREIMFRDYYGPHYAETEKLFLEAKRQPMTDLQKQRLQLIEDNLIVLQWRLRNAGYLPQKLASPLHRSDAQVAELLLAKNEDFTRFPNILAEPKIAPVKVALNQPAPANVKATEAPNADSILLYATRDGQVRLKPVNVRPGSSYLSYALTENAARTGKLLQTGIFYNGGDIVFEGKANTAYFLTVTAKGLVQSIANWDLTVENATPATAAFADGTLNLNGPQSPLYVYAPSGLSLAARAEGANVILQSQTAMAKALRAYPNAKTVLRLDDEWRFATDPQKQGTAQRYYAPTFNDSSWKTVGATDWWQNQGFDEYNGTAWYRKEFSLEAVTGEDPQGVAKRQILLAFGAVDGDAVVFLNGKKVGQHLLGKNFEGYDQPFIFDITSIVKPTQNIITVQVTKEKFVGGINGGVSVMTNES